MILEKLKINARNIHKFASTWFVAGSSAAGSVWFALPREDQVNVLAHLFFPMWVIPVVLGVVTLVARLWPQSAISPAVAAAKSETANQPPES